MTYQTQPKEQLLWERIKRRSKPGETVRVMPITKNIGLHHMKAKEFIRRWENNNLVVETSSPLTTKLTDKGRKVENLSNLN